MKVAKEKNKFFMLGGIPLSYQKYKSIENKRKNNFIPL